MTYRGRPTWYAGTKMRSRLEAAFAQWHEGLATWEYEPRCFASPTGQYLPDFRVDYTWDCWTYVEVKPTVEAGLAAMSRMEIIHASEPEAILCIYVPRPGWPPPDWRQVAQKTSSRSSWKIHA